MKKLITLTLISLLAVGPAQAGPRLTGRKSVTSAGTAVKLNSSSVSCTRIIVTAYEANTDIIVIGDASVDATEATRTGLTLFAGQTEYLNGGSRLDLSSTWIDSEVNGEGATWTCLN